MAFMYMENKIPEKPFDFFFSCLQVVLSLEDHSSEVQVVKHLLHSFSHPSPAPSPSGTLLPSSSRHKLGSVEGQPVGPGRPAPLSALQKFHSHKSHWFLCFSPTFFLEQGLITVGVGG